MNHMVDMKLPDEYIRAVSPELQGTLNEVEYRVHNYINAKRLLVTDQNIDSEEAGRETVKGDPIIKKCSIYLPAGYDESDKAIRYNVLYLLHGVGGSHREWLDSNGSIDGNYIICNMMDNLIAKGDIDPLIVVFPNGRSAYDWTDDTFNFEGTNLLGFYYFDYELRYDLIRCIESQYNTYADITETSVDRIEYNRKHRAIAGLSMGGMQALNLIVGGYRCDSVEYTGGKSTGQNRLDTTVLAPGMTDLFAYVGAFSNAPTSSEGKVLGANIAASEHKLHLLYMTCGDADEVSMSFYEQSIEGLQDSAGEVLGEFYQTLMPGGVHDFYVWNNGAYNFARLSFK